MNLTRKFILALGLTMLGVLSLGAAIRIRRDLARFETQRRASNGLLGRAVAGAAARTWSKVGLEQAFDLVKDANERESQVNLRWIWLDAPEGDPFAREVGLRGLRSIPPGQTMDVRARTPAGDFVYSYVPIPGSRKAALEVKQSLAEERAHVREVLLHAVVLTLALAVMCGLLVAALCYLLIGKPMRLLVEKARRVGRGDLSGELHLPQHDEVSELAEEMNSMCARLGDAQRRAARESEARLQALEQLRHADRLTIVGRLAAGLAHELGTPLNVVSARAEIIQDSCENDLPLIHTSARVVLDQTARMADILRQLLDFARRRPAQKAPTEVQGLTQKAVALLDGLARKRGVSLGFDARSAPRVHADSGQMQQALANLIVNAIDAMPRGGPVTISVGRERVRAPADAGGAETDCARIDVVDRGEGIGADALPHIFEPFFTTKRVGEGTGLGLSVAYGIVREHQGWIDVDSAPGKGSRFSIFIPAETV
jgi:two-component system, NtrC family, sensor kinase